MVEGIDPVLYEAIADKRLRGASYRAIASDLHVAEDTVRAVMAEERRRVFDAEHAGERLALEVRGLREIQKAYLAPAIDDHDDRAAAVWLKASAQLAYLLGANAPSSHTVRVITQSPAHEISSTDRIAAVIERLCSEGNQVSPDDEVGEPGKPN